MARRTKQLRRTLKHPRRRGIVLLVIISVLVLFMLMLVTFAVVAQHYNRAAGSFAHRRQVTAEIGEATHVLDDVLYQLLGEPATPASSLWGQSLLGDLYGESVNGVVSTPAVAEGFGIFVGFSALRDGNQTFANPQFSNVEGHHAGCVLTMKDGPCAGLSTLITHYGPGNVDNSPFNPLAPPNTTFNPGDPANPADPVLFRVEAFSNGLLPQVGNRFVVNGKPFNGTGLGRPPLAGPGVSSYANDYADPATGYQWALMPHISRWLDRGQAALALGGGADEPWDAYDYQNMHLAFVPTDPNGPGFVMPSFHRPDLVNYWDARIDPLLNHALFAPGNAALLRQIAFRPLGADHPFFTGSNPVNAFDPALPLDVQWAAMTNQLWVTPAGVLTDNIPPDPANIRVPNPWDVDNDNDGVRDSIWIDPGLPYATAPDGRKYKRLVAIMIKDLDGRVDVNATGHTEFIKGYARPETRVPDSMVPPTPIYEPLAGSPSRDPAHPFSRFAGMVPKGLGYGPADINFLNLFPRMDYAADGDADNADGDGSNATGNDDDPSDENIRFRYYRRMLQGTDAILFDGSLANDVPIPGRYGLDGQFFNTGNPPAVNGMMNRRPGYLGPNGPVPSNDPLTLIKMQGYGVGYTGLNFSNNASPPDVWGRASLALDYAGQPYMFSDYSPTAPFEYAAGQPVDWRGDGMEISAEMNDSPYEINLIDSLSSVDTPYTAAEMEALLRRFDPDINNMSPRLMRFISSQLFDPTIPNDPILPQSHVNRRANLMTFRSSHVPAPRGAVPYYMRENAAAIGAFGPVSPNILDICLARIRFHTPVANIPAPPDPVPNQTTPEAYYQSVLRQIMPFEFFQGRMFDVNRPFGNGEDDDFNGVDDDGDGLVDEPGDGGGNGIVDEPGETDHLATPPRIETAWTAGPFGPNLAAVFPLNDAWNRFLPPAMQPAMQHWWRPPNMAPYNDFTPPTFYLDFLDRDPHLYARQLYARHLYCTLLLLCDPLYDHYSETLETTLTDPVIRRRLFLRKLAQFAINAVDYRDPDAICTPFEYDENPFDGWHVDGRIGNDPATGAIGNENDTLPDGSVNPGGWLPDQARQVVWGMEFPDLQLTEHLAFHNRRVKDTAHDDGSDGDPQEKRFDAMMMPQDEDLDQYGIPQGTLLMELYCPRNSALNNPKVPLELYKPNEDFNGDGDYNDPGESPAALDLGRLAPMRPFMGGPARHPVWRAVVTSNPDDPVSGATSTIRALAATTGYPDSSVFEPAALGVTTERIIWFTPLDPAGVPEANLVFYERTGTLPGIGAVPPGQQARSTVLLPPGQYLVAGPRTDTRLGSLVDGVDGDPNTYELSPLQFSLAGGTFNTAGGAAMNGFNPYPQNGSPIRPVVGIVCAAKPPTGWGDQTKQVGMNISEPMPNPTSGSYYPEYMLPNGNYCDLSMPWATMTNECPDVPFDDDMAYSGPLFDDMTNEVRTGTREDFRSIFVQRLANPLIPWNPMPDDPEFGANYDPTLQVNPYITIDWSTLDLTVYSGNEDTDQQPDGTTWIDPSDPDPFDSDPPEMFAGRERGLPEVPRPTDMRFWANAVRDLPDTDTDTTDMDHYFHRRPDHTLGYLNSTLGAAENPAPLAGYEGFPAGGLPWLTWNNRPFANPAELLLVPASTPNRLGVEFGIGNSVDNVSPYTRRLTTDGPNGDGLNSQGENYSGHFGHLLPFFLTNDTSTPAAPRNGDLYRLFDFVETPSLYVGAEKWYQPNYVNDEPTTPAFDPPMYGFTYRAPFNKLTRFRDPGRVNLNTIVDPEVWNAVVATYPELQSHDPMFRRMETWFHLVRGRRGYDAPAPGDNDTSIDPVPDDMFRSSSAFPSIFSQPFRPADAFDLMPLPGMKLARPADSTHLRRIGISSGPAQPPLPPDPAPPAPPYPPEAVPATPDDPLLNNRAYLLEEATVGPNPDPPPQVPRDMMSRADVSYGYKAADRNPALRYQPYTKLSNLVTTTSNAYAVWITVGYFEVELNPGGADIAHPDGFRLGPELRFEDGTTRRPRGFYIIDRSIPAAFEPGQPHNLENLVLLRRYLDQ